MMENLDFKEKIADLLPDISLRFQEPLAKHTSLRIGGPAEVMALPEDAGQLRRVLSAANRLRCPIKILGAGTNVLVPDEGVEGLVICLKDCLDGIEAVSEWSIRVMSGVTMTRAAVYAANLGLSGLEFAHGIPGTVGGGVYMNAGAYGGEIGQVCQSVEILDSDGEKHVLSRDEMAFSYRHSCLEGKEAIVLSTEFVLEPKSPEQIRMTMRELMARRTASQPLDLPSAGSAFKRPAQGYAAALIQASGLKGYRVGNAAISEKHAGFAVNLGGATAEDMRRLLRQVSDRVFADSGIRLEPEIRIW